MLLQVAYAFDLITCLLSFLQFGVYAHSCFKLKKDCLLILNILFMLDLAAAAAFSILGIAQNTENFSFATLLAVRALITVCSSLVILMILIPE